MNSLDSRDYTKKPAAYLSPIWILRMRLRLREYVLTGRLNWYLEGLNNVK